MAVGNVDAHVTAAGRATPSRPGQMVAIMGTSTCHVMNGDRARRGARHVRRGRRRHRRRACGATRPGRAASATSSPGSSTPRARRRTRERGRRAGSACTSYLTALAAAQPVGEHGLVALDWTSGNRSVLVDHDLSGVIVGLTLATRPEDVYRALLEATAFGTRMIVEAFEAAGVPVDEFVVAGGLLKNRFLMQIYADVLRRPLSLIGSDQGPALGSAIHAAVAAGAYPDVAAAAAAMGQREPGRLPARRRPGRRLRRAVRRVPRRCTTTSARGGNDVLHRLRRDPQRGGALTSDDDRRRDAVAAAAARGLRRCTPSWSATTWSPGRPATSRPGCPATDLLVIKPSGVAYDELDAGTWSSATSTATVVEGELAPVQRHRRARLRLPAHARGRRGRAHPLHLRLAPGPRAASRSRAC